MHKHHPVRIFGISALITVIVGVLVGWLDGLTGLWIYCVLVLLEVTFSFDNAVVNSKILNRLSDFWQTMFLTIGIFFAVFVVRFLLPLFIVMITAGMGAGEVVDLAVQSPEEYSHRLHEAAPLIDSFGGAFLFLIGLSYFVDRNKDVHWLKKLEKGLSRLGEIRFIKLIVMLVVMAVLYLTVDEHSRSAVAIAGLLGVLLHVGLEAMSSFFEKRERNVVGIKKKQVGMAAFASFMYLQVLDASFSFDGVIGAFAITSSLLLIMAGLGAGALWVRSFTVYLVRTGTLAKYKYLEHGAHWAILALGVVMLVKLYHIEAPEWFTGSLGLIFIATAVTSSVLEKRSLEAKK